MKKMFFFILLAVGLISSLSAGQEEFCDGFKKGYRYVKGDTAIIPVCPVKPVKKVESTDFEEGLKAGIQAALKGK